jgi:hypothetical protein
MKSSHTYFNFKGALTGVPGLAESTDVTLTPKYPALKTKSPNPQDV